MTAHYAHVAVRAASGFMIRYHSRGTDYIVDGEQHRHANGAWTTQSPSHSHGPPYVFVRTSLYESKNAHFPPS
jgi:hypothetical protein